MTWVFLPDAPAMGLASAPDMAASTSDCSWQSRVFTPAVLLSGSPRRKKQSLLECWVDMCPVLPNMAPDLRGLDTSMLPSGAPALLHRPRCGTMCGPSSVTHGAGVSTPSSRGIHASRSAPPASVEALMMSGTYGLTFPGSSTRSSPNGVSSKTSRAISASALKPSCETYGKWATRLRLAYSRRAKLARRTKGSGSSSWLTPDVPNGGRTLSPDVSSTGMTPDGKKRQVGLQNQAIRELANWGTPRASDGEKGGPNQSFGAGGMPLPAQVAQWPTPVSRDHKGENSADHIAAQRGRAHMDQLPNAVAHGWHRPDPARRIDGPALSQTLHIWRRLRAYVIASHGRATWRRLMKGRDARRLNPLFVEWLMGWPPGHALCAASETEFTLWQQHMRGALSQMPTASAPWIWKPPADRTDVLKQITLI